ncbi:MAG: selenium cofactor biosynthesis protein YqeC [Anaerolineales bacterium]|nr:selenium cofactor biosynthesis protein YqeC [Anaerolineales bacterium]
MNLTRALRINPLSPQRVAFTGAGGKTTALFQLARELKSAIVASATHLGAWQVSLADHHIIANSINDLKDLPARGVILVTGEIENERTKPVTPAVLDWLRAESENEETPLLIEADGSRQKPLKAPAAHEPPIPDFAEIVVVVAGLNALGEPLADARVHRAKIFSQLSGLQIGQTITPEAVVSALAHPQGGLKNIPNRARRVAFLNQADTPELQSIGGKMARKLRGHFDSVVVGSLRQNTFQTIERCGGIILAAGESKRFGISKQLLDWNGKPFVRQVAETALRSDLDPVVVVTGFDAARVESALAGLPVQIVHNPDYQNGQSASIKKGIQSLEANIGACVFLLADQPQIPVEIIRALTESRAREMQSILAPLVMEERRANPVLFDRVTFDDLLKLEGDVGGRAIFDKHRVEYIPWHDNLLLLDVDTPEDYERLKKL